MSAQHQLVSFVFTSNVSSLFCLALIRVLFIVWSPKLAVASEFAGTCTCALQDCGVLPFRRNAGMTFPLRAPCGQ